MRDVIGGALMIATLVACTEPTSPQGGAEGRVAAEPVADPAAAEAEVADAPVVDLEGRLIQPLAQIESAAVLLFVSTHCPISNRYAPTMRTLAERWRSQGVAAWLVYPDPSDDAAAIEAHRQAYSLSLPAVRDPGHRLVRRAGVRVTPEAAVFTPGAEAPAYAGRIDDRVVEFGDVRAQASAHELSDAVQAVLGGGSPQAPGADAIGCYISDLR